MNAIERAKYLLSVDVAYVSDTKLLSKSLLEAVEALEQIVDIGCLKNHDGFEGMCEKEGIECPACLARQTLEKIKGEK